MKVRWEKSLSYPFYVSNGVRKGGVMSPVLFSDGLLQKLADSGVGCHWGNLFVMLIMLCCWLPVHLP